MIGRNSVFLISPDWKGRPFGGLCRFLAADGQGAAALIAIPAKHRTCDLRGPVKVSLTEFLLQIEEGHVTAANYPAPRITLESLSDAESRALKKNAAIINSLEIEDDILFNASVMAQFLKKAHEKQGLPERTIRRLLYSYYVGGQTELALVPHFKFKGGPGKPQKKGTRKRGRHAVGLFETSNLALPEIREKLRDGVENHYLPGENTFHIAYVETMKDHFSREGADRKADNVVDILLPKNQLPTKWQFHNMIRILEKEKKRRIAIPGRMRQPDVLEERRGRATDGVPGPGYRYEIDATKMQIQLVSRWNRTKLVGTATLYIVVDVWSSAIVGYYFTLENASWRVAASALANAFSKKTEVFDRLGLSYVEEDWPCRHLPSILMGDRAELLTDSSIGVAKLGIKIEIAAPMCPEMKGTVESKFNEIKKAHYSLPGAYAKNRKRREKDGKDDAVLNIDEAEKILVQAIIAINNQPVSPNRIPPEFIEDGEEDISRIGLYVWGLKNKSGSTRTLSENEFKYFLLSPGYGSAVQEGIKFKSHIFRPTCSMLQILSMKKDKIEIRYNEHNAYVIDFINPSSGVWEQAYNINKYIQNRPVAFYEFDLFRKEVGRLGDAMKMQNSHNVVMNRKSTGAMLHQAKAEKKDQAAVTKTSKSRQQIRKNKEQEKSALRSEASHQLLPIPSPEPTPPMEVAISPRAPMKSVAALTADLWEEDE